MNYSIFHVETYGHGKRASNTLADADKVTIEDHDGHRYVYECDADAEAQAIAAWFLITYEHHDGEWTMQGDGRTFWVEHS